jgi:DNA-binding protein HU-beta
MTRNEMITHLSDRTGLPKSKVQAVLFEYEQMIKDCVGAGIDVNFNGFASFKSVAKPERTARNPRTGETVTVPAQVVCKVKLAKWK